MTGRAPISFKITVCKDKRQRPSFEKWGLPCLCTRDALETTRCKETWCFLATPPNRRQLQVFKHFCLYYGRGHPSDFCSSPYAWSKEASEKERKKRILPPWLGKYHKNKKEPVGGLFASHRGGVSMPPGLSNPSIPFLTGVSLFFSDRGEVLSLDETWLLSNPVDMCFLFV